MLRDEQALSRMVTGRRSLHVFSCPLMSFGCSPLARSNRKPESKEACWYSSYRPASASQSTQQSREGDLESCSPLHHKKPQKNSGSLSRCVHTDLNLSPEYLTSLCLHVLHSKTRTIVPIPKGAWN